MCCAVADEVVTLWIEGRPCGTLVGELSGSTASPPRLPFCGAVANDEGDGSGLREWPWEFGDRCWLVHESECAGEWVRKGSLL